jgi:hypothetical protein
MTTTEHAALIRATLKRAHGWSSRQVSVRAEYFSMGSSIDVIVKDPAIPLPAVKAVAEGSESIRRCEFSGEILSGGNRYVSVRYSHEAQATIGACYVEAVQRAIDAVRPGSSGLEPIGDTGFLVGRPNAWLLTLWGPHSAGCLGQHNGAQGIAETIGNLIVAREGARKETAP